MTTGRRDYTWGFLNEAAGEGRFRESFSKYFAVGIGTFIVSDAYTYTVPIGKRLGLCKVHCSTENGAYNEISVLKNAEIVMVAMFTCYQVFGFTEINPLYFVAGETLLVRIQNRDEVTSNFYGGVNGVLESVI